MEIIQLLILIVIEQIQLHKMKLLTHQIVIIHHLLIQIQLILQTLLQTIILIQEEQIVLITLLQTIQETIQEIEQLLKILLHQLIIESNAKSIDYSTKIRYI